MTEEVSGDVEVGAGCVKAAPSGADSHLVWLSFPSPLATRLRPQWNNNTCEEGKAMKGDSFLLASAENKACILFPQCASH